MGIQEKIEFRPEFSPIELHEFGNVFDTVRARLPKLFATFWHRWSYIPGETPALLVYAEDGAVALCLVREDRSLYRAICVGLHGADPYSATGPTIAAAIRSVGL
ncbi:MAG TPA: hypothetical protein VLI06_12430 [Solimonas sp.]|nr:hypothetical protein [Solimonas sp.]